MWQAAITTAVSCTPLPLIGTLWSEKGGKLRDWMFLSLCSRADLLQQSFWYQESEISPIWPRWTTRQDAIYIVLSAVIFLYISRDKPCTGRKKSPLWRIISNQETCKRLVGRSNSLCLVVLSFTAKSTHQCTHTHPFKRILRRKLVSHFFHVQPHFLKGVLKVPPRVTNVFGTYAKVVVPFGGPVFFWGGGGGRPWKSSCNKRKYHFTSFRKTPNTNPPPNCKNRCEQKKKPSKYSLAISPWV